MLGSLRKFWKPAANPSAVTPHGDDNLPCQDSPSAVAAAALPPNGWVRQNFAQILADHQSMVYSLALRSLRNTARAEELTQEVFLSLFENHAAIASPDHLRHWLRRVAARRCIDDSRRQRHRQTYGLEEVREPASQDRPDQALFHRQIYALIDRLPAQARVIVLLRYQDDLDPAEIAELLEVPLGTVKSRLARSLQALRLLVQREPQPGSSFPSSNRVGPTSTGANLREPGRNGPGAEPPSAFPLSRQALSVRSTR